MLPPDYFMEKIIDRVAVEPTGCWSWGGWHDRDGYGHVSNRSLGWQGRMHRVMYEWYHGSIGSGPLDHLCRNRGCCNPTHLEPVTHRENILRGVGLAAANAVKTHCVHGHEFTPANTYHRHRHGGGRICKTCIYERQARRRAKGVMPHPSP